MVISLLLSVATCVVWVRSGWQSDGIWYDRSTLTVSDASACVGQRVKMWSREGGISLQAERAEYRNYRSGTFSDAPSKSGFYWSSRVEHTDWQPVKSGTTFAAEWNSDSRKTSDPTGMNLRGAEIEVQFPHWFLALLLSILPAVAVIRMLYHHRRLQHLGADARPCPACGYDCRASPGRCPECGKPVNRAATACRVA